MIGIFASRGPYRAHTQPIREALGDCVYAIKGDQLAGVDVDLWLAASARDYLQLRRHGRPRVFMEHGTGLQWYPAREVGHIVRANAILAPNEFIAQRYRDFGRRVRVEVVGTPKMDRLIQIASKSPQDLEVAISFHWTGVTKSSPTLREYREAVRELAEAVPVLGHGHPKVWPKIEEFFTGLGIEPVREFEDVVRRAGVYVCDHSSTMYEWAALGRPVVMLERTNGAQLVPHPSGLRYSHHAGIGPTATPSTLTDAVGQALDGDPDHAAAREAATAELYPHLGRSTPLVVDVLRDVAASRKVA